MTITKAQLLNQMTEEVLSQMKSHHQTGTLPWTYETGVRDLPVQVGCLTKLVMQTKGERYAHGLSDEELKIKISDELADITSLALFIAHDLNIDMEEAWAKMLKGDAEKVKMRIKRG